MFAEPTDLNGPDLAKTLGSGTQGKDGKDSVTNGHAEGEVNPFAEYMWMENEEEYNRQVCVRTHTHTHCRTLCALIANV